MADPCPICEVGLKKSEDRGECLFFECPRCGPYSMSRSAHDELGWRLTQRDDAAQKISYALYRMTKNEQGAMLSSSLLENIILNTQLPRPQEQFENLIVWLGSSQPTMGGTIGLLENVVAATGATDMQSVGFLVSQAVEAGYVSANVNRYQSGDYVIPSMQLTMSGWSLFEELQRGKASGRYAFIAMQFGDAELDKITADCFKPAVAATGFELKRLDEAQPAGLIDDRLRVEIRQSRFLLADLTHHNKGAYWEAGFAEGLGKPVIYLCRKDVFDSKKEGTHFDTNHHLTVVWDPAQLTEAAERLKATIRATLPEESKFTD